MILHKNILGNEKHSLLYIELFSSLDFYTESEEVLLKKIDKKYLDMCSENFEEHKDIIDKIKQD
jgi:hypothetical protein